MPIIPPDIVISSGNFIGTDGDGTNDANERNGISGNQGDGVSLTNTGANQNRIAGNLIGTQADGSSAPGNGGSGVGIPSGPSGNIIGSNGAAAEHSGTQRHRQQRPLRHRPSRGPRELSEENSKLIWN